MKKESIQSQQPTYSWWYLWPWYDGLNSQQISVSCLRLPSSHYHQIHVTASSSIPCICLLILVSLSTRFFPPLFWKSYQLHTSSEPCDCAWECCCYQIMKGSHMAWKLWLRSWHVQHLCHWCSNTNLPLSPNSCMFCGLDGNHMTLLLCPTPGPFILHQSNLSLSCVYPSLHRSPRWSKCITIHANSKIIFPSLLGFNQQAANMHCHKDNRSIVIDKWAHLFHVGAVFNASSTAYLHPITSIPRPQSDIFF